MQTYKTFLRSCRNWSEFSKARKITQETGLTYDEARERCQEYNNSRNPRQVKRGTKLEFTAE